MSALPGAGTSAGSGGSGGGGTLSLVGKIHYTFSRRYQKALDDLIPYVVPRWVATAVLFVLYAVRTYMLEGFYIVTYALGLYIINLLIAFLSPKFDPALEEEMAADDEDIMSMKVNRDEEFRPFIRKLPEFKFWHSLTLAIVISLVCTLFPFLDIPVYVPILVTYFFVLFLATMRKQITHMVKHKYIPFNFGKQKYKGRIDVDGPKGKGKGK